MSSMLDSLLQQLSSSDVSKLGAQIGADPATTQSALSAALPAILAALSKNASDPRGARDLHDAVEQDHDGSVVDHLSSYLDQPDINDGQGILKHALGGRQGAVEAGIAERYGLDPQTISKLLAIGAPLILGMLAKRQREGGLNADQLAGMLQTERQAVESRDPDLMSSLSSILDMNDDGGIMDDVKRLAGGLFGRRNDG
jgi:hypothetical protein